MAPTSPRPSDDVSLKFTCDMPSSGGHMFTCDMTSSGKMLRSSSAELLTELRSRAPKMLRSPSAEFTESIRSAARNLKTNCLAFDIPASMRRPYIITRYRNNHDFRRALKSLFELHNETANVWSHLLGGCVFVWLLYALRAREGCDAGVECVERWPLYVFLASAILCLFSSALYHLVGAANERYIARFAVVDYAGIVALIVGSCVPVVHYGFGARFPSTRLVYERAIYAFGVLVLAMVGAPWFDQWKKTRIAAFIALALSGVVALLHAMVSHDFAPPLVALFHGVAAMGATYLAGVTLYATNLPEALVPRKFDVFGSSHNWWHACVFAAALTHWTTVRALWHDAATIDFAAVARVSAHGPEHMEYVFT